MLKLIVRAISSLFDIACKSGPIGLIIFFSTLTLIIGTITFTILSIAGDTKQRYISTYEFKVPISYSVIDKYLDPAKDNLTPEQYLKEIKFY